MKTEKSFTKNQIVVMFRPTYGEGCGEGTWGWRRARVVSCGKVKMTVETLDGVMLGRNYEPTKDTHDQYGDLNRVIFMDDMSDDDIVRKALDFANIDIESAKERYNYQIKHSTNESYIESTKTLLNHLFTISARAVSL